MEPLLRGSESWKNSEPLIRLTLTCSLRRERRRGRSTGEGEGQEVVVVVAGVLQGANTCVNSD